MLRSTSLFLRTNFMAPMTLQAFLILVVGYDAAEVFEVLGEVNKIGVVVEGDVWE